jgi:hypothetical protein
MTVFTGHTGNAGHFLQPTASAMGHRTTQFSQGPRPLAYALSRIAPQRADALARVIAGVHEAAVLSKYAIDDITLLRGNRS